MGGIFGGSGGGGLPQGSGLYDLLQRGGGGASPQPAAAAAPTSNGPDWDRLKELYGDVFQPSRSPDAPPRSPGSAWDIDGALIDRVPETSPGAGAPVAGAGLPQGGRAPFRPPEPTGMALALRGLYGNTGVHRPQAGLPHQQGEDDGFFRGGWQYHQDKKAADAAAALPPPPVYQRPTYFAGQPDDSHFGIFGGGRGDYGGQNDGDPGGRGDYGGRPS